MESIYRYILTVTSHSFTDQDERMSTKNFACQAVSEAEVLNRQMIMEVSYLEQVQTQQNCQIYLMQGVLCLMKSLLPDS